jgi:hypothetical protein
MERPTATIPAPFRKTVHCILVTIATQDPAFYTHFNHLPTANLTNLTRGWHEYKQPRQQEN